MIGSCLCVIDQLNCERQPALLREPDGSKTRVVHILARTMTGEVLRELAVELPHAGDDICANILLGHVERQLQSAGLCEFQPLSKQQLLERGGMIMVDALDGLDERLMHNLP